MARVLAGNSVFPAAVQDAEKSLVDPQQTKEQGEWVGLPEAARRLFRSERTVREWLKAGHLRGRKDRVRGIEEWRVWFPETEEQSEEPTEEPPPASSGTAGNPPGVPLEVYQDLLSRHEQAVLRLGGLQAEAARVPMLMEDAAASAARSADLESRVRDGERERLQMEARATDAERELLRAAALHAAERRRGQAWAVGAIVLAVLAAVLLALLALRAG